MKEKEQNSITENLVASGTQKTFYVWINPKDIYAHHNANLVGSFVSVSNKEDNLMFLPNQSFSGYISPFQANLLRSYSAEYQLEIARKLHFLNYPSRLIATFLFEEESEAMKYRDSHAFHVGERELKVGKTVGHYTYSRHDLGWIDFLRSPLVLEPKTIDSMVHAYWKGETVENFKLPLLEKSISVTAEPIIEVLFIGRIDFERE